MPFRTEAQARTKWCPLARHFEMFGGSSAEGAAAVNRSEPIGEGSRCIAAECMAWRWHKSDIGFCGAFGHPSGDSR